MAAPPPLNGLKAFESAARNMSFKKAADELCVTHGAVSRHIRKLEEHLGVQLFVRHNKRVELTASGALFMNEISDPFRRIYEATSRMMSEGDGQTIRLSVPPTFAIRWLVPRLARFQARHPEVSVQISTPFNPNFRQENDMAVSYGIHAATAGTSQERLLDEILLPVISPSLSGELKRLRTASDVSRFTLLHSMIRLDDWPMWLKAAKASDIDSQSGLKFENSGLVYQALSEGLGAAIAQLAFVADDIVSGRLLAPFDTALRRPNGYYLLQPAGKTRNWSLEAFRTWILEEAASLPHELIATLDVVED